MITFRPGARPGLEFFGLEDELKVMLGCEVDIVTRRSIEAGPNPIRRRPSWNPPVKSIVGPSFGSAAGLPPGPEFLNSFGNQSRPEGRLQR